MLIMTYPHHVFRPGGDACWRLVSDRKCHFEKGSPASPKDYQSGIVGNITGLPSNRRASG